MAQSKVSANDEDKSLECSICFSDFEQPKQLPCLHTFCLKCVKGHCDEKKAGEKISCPLCRTEFSIPQGGVEKLPDNHFILRLVLMKSNEKNKPRNCDLCTEIGEKVKAEAFCVDCTQSLCVRCKKLHFVSKSLKTHKVVGNEEMPSNEDLLKMQSSICSFHPNKEIEFYCSDCKKLLCSICHFGNHTKHVCKLYQEIVKQKKDEFTKDENNILKCYSENCDQLKKLQSAQQEAMLKASEATQSINEAFAGGIKLLESQRDKLLHKVETMKVSRLKEIESHSDLGQLHDIALNNFLAYSRLVAEKGTDLKIIRVADELHNRAENLIKSQDARKKQNLSVWCIKYAPPLAASEKYVEGLIGHVLDADNFSDTCVNEANNKKQETHFHTLQDIDKLNLKNVVEGERKATFNICRICLTKIKSPKTLNCTHTFCSACIDNSFKKSEHSCPICGPTKEIRRGNQPEGTMNVNVDPGIQLPGYENYGAIVIQYSMPDGTQGPEHPEHGFKYKGEQVTAYLPNNPEGRKVCELLKKAFDQRLIFTIGRSSLYESGYSVKSNGISHKTAINGPLGYPDHTYLARVKKELRAKRITD